MYGLLFANARDGGPVRACFDSMASTDRGAQAKKPRRVGQQRSYNPHSDVPVVVSIMRYLQDVQVTNDVTLQRG